MTQCLNRMTTKWAVLIVTCLQFIICSSNFAVGSYAAEMKNVFNITQNECKYKYIHTYLLKHNKICPHEFRENK